MGKAEATQQNKTKIDDVALASEFDANNYEPEQMEALDNDTWERKLFELHGTPQELRYQSLFRQESTSNYKFSGNELEIFDGISLVLNDTSGQVVAYNNAPKDLDDNVNDTVVVFSTTGGKLKFHPKNMEYLTRQEVELTKVDIVLPAGNEKDQVVQPEVSALVKGAIALEPYSGLRMELGTGQYVKTATDAQGVFDFQDTKVTFTDKVLKESLKTKADDTGIRLEEGKEVKVNINSFWPANDIREQAGNKLDIEAFLVLDEIQGAYIRMEHTGVLTIGGTEFRLKDWVLRDDMFESAAEATTVFHGFPMHLMDVTIGDKETFLKAKEGFIDDWRDESKAKGDLQDIDFRVESSKGVMKATSADITLEQEPVRMFNISLNEGHNLQADIAKGTLNGKEVDMTYVHLDKELMLRADSADAEIEGFKTQMKNYSYQKTNGFSYDNADVSVRLNRGLNPDDKAGSEDRAKRFVQFSIGRADHLESDFSSGTQSENKISINETLVEIGSTENKEILEKEDSIYTRDGFAKLESGVIDFRKEENNSAKVAGKGDFKILEMPYIVTNKAGNKKSVRKAFGPEELVKDVDFIIDNNGTINAEFGDDNEVEMKIGRKVENGSENIINKITLGGVSIKDGYLKATSLISESGFGYEKEVEESEGESEARKKLKRLFGECSFSGTFANTAGSVNITESGIEAQEGETTPGTLSVGGLFGFLGGSINYPKGEVEVKAEKEVEKESDEGILMIHGKAFIGDGVKIPFGVWPIALEMGIRPSASIGGELGLKMSRGKSFDEEMKEGDNLELGGNLKVKGQVGVSVFLGLVADAVIASATLRMNGGLKAAINGELKGGAKLGVSKEGKLEQSDDFKFSGKIEGNLNSTLSLSSDVKILFWKAQLFEIKLAEKEFGKLSFEGEGSKEKNQEAFTKGWKLNKMGLSFLGMKKKTKVLLENKAYVKEGKEVKRIQQLVNESSKEADYAWQALAQLKEKQKNMIYVVGKNEKAAMTADIDRMTKEVIDKITTCIECLAEQQTGLEKEAAKLQAKALGKEATMNQANQVVKEAEFIIDAAHEGGFLDAITKFRGAYNNQLYKMAMAQMTNSMIMGEYKKGIERHKSSLEQDTDLDELLGEYKEYTTYQYMMQSKVIDGTRTLKDFEFCQSYYDYIMMNEPSLIEKQLKQLDSIENKDDDQKYLEQKLLKQKEKRKGKDLTVFDLFQAAIYGTSGNARWNSVDGETLYASPEEKMRLIEVCSRLTIDEPKKRKDETAKQFSIRKNQFKNANDYLMESIDQQYSNVFSKTYRGMIRFSVGKNAGSVFDQVDELKRDKQKAIAAYQKVKADLDKKKESINQIKDKRADYDKKLQMLADNADKAIIRGKFDSIKAEKALDILTNDYGEKMKDGKEMIATLSSDSNSRMVVDSIMKGKNPLPTPINNI